MLRSMLLCNEEKIRKDGSMKKLIVILVLVMVACAPAVATVTCCSSKSGSTVTVNYSVSDVNAVRAFALDMSVSTGTITGVSCSGTSPLGYYIYPGSIQIVSGSICSTCYGSCICSSAYPGTKLGIGTSAVTVEMGSLYTGTTKPATSGKLLTFTISNTAANVTLAANAVRGGVVMERAEETPSVTFTTCQTDCLYLGRVFPATKGFVGLTVNSTHMGRWNYLGKPNCWCCAGQKRGNNTYTGSSANRPDNVDLGAVKNTNVWMKYYTQSGYLPCADVDFSGRVDTIDVGRIKNTNNYMQTVGGGPPCP